mmetsp:Transcript_20324/g.56639  ORF Transcript_20324/g.56639 Transcript_20324/m.56639 type:complete len:84 (+) Transcript_20324:3124-3375(+)
MGATNFCSPPSHMHSGAGVFPRKVVGCWTAVQAQGLRCPLPSYAEMCECAEQPSDAQLLARVSEAQLFGRMGLGSRVKEMGLA